MTFANRVNTLTPEGAYVVFEKAQALEAAGRTIIHLEIGQPDAPTPENVARAGMDAIRAGHTRYTGPAGLPALRRIVAEDAGRRRGMRIDPARVVIGPGSKPALFFPTLALVHPGDEVLYPDPGFPTYRAMVEVAGGVPVPVPLLESEDFSFDLEAFDRLVSARTRLIVLNSPSNPTGGVMPPAALEHVAAVARQRDIWVLSDEIYARLVYESPAPSIAALPGMAERTIICDGFSKTYAMTGWRLGYGIMPKALAERVELLLTHSVGATATFTQMAGVEAIQGTQEPVEAVVREYRRRRDVLVAGLNAIPGVTCRTPQGAFYAFPNVGALGKSSNWLAEHVLEEVGVAVLPGSAFGRNGEGYLRVCFANSMENIQAALPLLAHAMRELKP
ncbi:MAG: pyridoxal phosphate-dependent aminotransferase [Gemmatimonadales bacterium]|nr:MAG: pyridoxal phosphate-dependent aminotransferase [Gemmatimonadales bacterium]